MMLNPAQVTQRLIMMMRILYIFLCLLMLSSPVLADDKGDAEAIVKGKLDAVFTVLQKKELDQQAKKKEVDEIVTPMFDFDLMAKLTLGKERWTQLPQEKKEKFTELYIARLKKTYLEMLALYTDEKVLFEPPAQVKNKVHIPTELVSKGRKISILYKLYKPADGWKVYDLEIQGSSIIRSQKAEFSAFLQSGTIDELLHKMEKPADT